MNPTDGRMYSSPVWVPGDRFEDVRRKSREYVKEKWGETTRECEVVVWGRERDEGTGFSIRIYTSERDDVPTLAERLFGVAIGLGTKIYGVYVVLHNRLLSQEEICRDDMPTVEGVHREQQQILKDGVMEDDRVKEALSEEAKNVDVFAQTNLSCELEGEGVTKVIVETIADYLERASEYLKTLVEELRRRGLAGKIVGYRLWRDLDRLKIDDVDVSGETVTVWLMYPAKQVS